LRIEIGELERLKSRLPALNSLFARYADALLAQLFQSAACNAAHSIEQRTAKWLLYVIERTGTDEVPQTQEQLASMLGVGRSYISRVIQRFKQDRVLETRRGALFVSDISRLSEMCCGCHDSICRHFDIVLKGVYISRTPMRLERV
jgi:CRP-like cAMP-binding protein